MTWKQRDRNLSWESWRNRTYCYLQTRLPSRDPENISQSLIPTWAPSTHTGHLSVSPGSHNWPWREAQFPKPPSSHPCPSSPWPLCAWSLWGVGTAFSATQNKYSLHHQPSSILPSMSTSTQPSPVHSNLSHLALPTGHTSEPTSGDISASSPPSDCRALRQPLCSASPLPPPHLSPDLLPPCV